MRKISSTIVLILSLILISITYQNCGEVRIATPDSEELPQLAAVRPEIRFCSQPGPAFGTPVNFVFVVDMSLSNVGGAMTQSCSTDGICLWRLGKDIMPDPERPNGPDSAHVTDLAGLRFQAVQNFVQTCSAASQSKFSIMGFGTEAIFGSSSTESCASPFVNQAGAWTNITSLRNVQASDTAPPNYRSSPEIISPYRMSNTSYYSSLKCLDNKIRNDMGNSGDNQPYYQVFYLTDGKPTDFDSFCTRPNLTPQQRAECNATNPQFMACSNSYNSCNSACPNPYTCGSDTACLDQAYTCLATCSNTRNNCMNAHYTNTVYPQQLTSLRQFATTLGAGMNLQPLYYGQDAEYPAAQTALNILASAGGNTTGTLRVTDLATLGPQLCASFQPSAQVSYQVASSFVVNLTAVREQGELKGDSDMDGLSDEKEATLAGFNALNARSAGALDRVCLDRFGGVCTGLMAGCQNTTVGFKTTNCEQQALARTLSGLDSDSDLIPDFLELIRGTHPSVNDAQGSFASDYISNIEKIKKGLNVFENVTVYPYSPASLMDYNLVQYTTPMSGCASALQGYNFQFNQALPLVDVQAYTDPTAASLLDLSHVQNENVFLVAIVLQPEGGSGSQRRKLMVAKFKLRSGASTSITLQPSDFVFAGDL